MDTQNKRYKVKSTYAYRDTPRVYVYDNFLNAITCACHMIDLGYLVVIETV